MEEGLWQINPNLIKNLRYYVSLMPDTYRMELLRDTYIPTPMGSDLEYEEWKNYNFDGRYNLKKKPSWDGGIFEEDDLPPLDEDTNAYYFLLFFFSAFKRSPESVEDGEVKEWIGRCLIDVWKEDPSITPYASKLRGWRGLQNVAEMDLYDGLWEENLDGIDLLSGGEGIINPNAILDARNFDTLGLSESEQSGLYKLFISPVFRLLNQGGVPFRKNIEVYRTSPNHHYIMRSIIDKEAYMDNAKELFPKRAVMRDMSYKQFMNYWTQYSYVIPIGFLSREEDSVRFMNYSLKSFQNLK